MLSRSPCRDTNCGATALLETHARASRNQACVRCPVPPSPGWSTGRRCVLPRLRCYVGQALCIVHLVRRKTWRPVGALLRSRWHRSCRSKVGVASAGSQVVPRTAAPADHHDDAAEALEGSLPAYCGLVVSADAVVLVIGVAHRDGGVSGQAAKALIERFKPDVCLLELDQQRFFRMALSRCGSGQQRSHLEPVEVLSDLTGIPLQAGDEFFQAFEAAQKSGAVAVLGDVSRQTVIDGYLTALRRVFSDPVGLVADGVSTLRTALGDVSWGPRKLDSPPATAGIFLPSALAAEGFGRAGPLIRAAVVSIALISALNYAVQMGLDSTESASDASIDVLSTVGSIINVVVVGYWSANILSTIAFATSFLMDRDQWMVGCLSNAISMVDGLRRPVSGTPPELIRCQWTKRAQESPHAIHFDASVPTVHPGAPRAEFRYKLPVLPAPTQSPPTWQPHVLEGQCSNWLPLLTVNGDIVAGQECGFNLYEARFLRLMDAIRASSSSDIGLMLAVAAECYRTERPISAIGHESQCDTEIDLVMSGMARVVKVEEMWEARDEAGHRSWKIACVATSSEIQLHACHVASDELGALWISEPARHDDDAVKPRSVAARRRVRCAAVVGLLHVNGIVKGMEAYK